MIIFFTVFKDIGRETWNAKYKRQNNDYFFYFKQLIDNIEYPLVVYVQSHVLKELVNAMTFKNNIMLVDASSIPTFLETHLVKEREIMESDEYKQKIPEDRKLLPEHCVPEYTLMTHSKIQFLSYTKKLCPGYDYYSWIDFGFVRDDLTVLPKNIDFSKLGENILFNNLNNPSRHYDANTMLKSGEIYIAGGSFVVHSHLVEIFERIYTEKLNEWQKNCIADDEQSLIYQLTYTHKHLFNIVFSGDWRCMFKNFLNKK
jgi:hypothetical protein